MDGYYDLAASGHLEENESLKDAVIREAIEEANIKINADDLKFVLLFNDNSTNLGYIKVYFVAEKYEGEIAIGEPDKCSELSWHDINNIPDNIIPYLVKQIECFKNGINYNQIGF